MDKLIYIAGSGAKQILEKQATTSHNLANASTTGFKAQIDSFRAVQVKSDEMPTRAFVVDSTAGADFSAGSIQETGRSLDVAVQGKGWLTVQSTDGSEAYTRSGSLVVGEDGVLKNQSGLVVVGDGGPISVPQGVNVAVAKDGTISGIDSTGKATVNILGKLKLVNPSESNLERRDDGLFKLKDGSVADSDPNVSVLGGALEGSNVNIVEEMVQMISSARQYETQMKLLTTAESDANKASQILSLS